MFQQLSTTSFALSGFAFTSLSLFIGLFADRPSEAADMISILLTCTVLFLLSGEMAREAYKISKWLLAETIYLATLSTLAISFWFYIATKFSFVNPWTTAALSVTIGYLAYRTIHNVYVAVKVR